MTRLRWIIFDSFAGLALALSATIGVTVLLATLRRSPGTTFQFTHARQTDLAARQLQISQTGGQFFGRVAIEEFESDDNLKVLVANQGRGGWRISSDNNRGWEQPVWLDLGTPGFHFKKVDERPGYGVARSRAWVVALPAWSIMLFLSILPAMRAYVGLLQRGQRHSGHVPSSIRHWFGNPAPALPSASFHSHNLPRIKTLPRPVPFSGWTHPSSPISKNDAPRRRKAG